MNEEPKNDAGLDPDLAARLDALPRELEPERDLWPAIEGRLASPLTGPEREARVIPLWPAVAVGLAAAAALALWWRPAAPTEPAPTEHARADAEPAPTEHARADAEPDAPLPSAPETTLVPGEDDYRDAATLLTQAIEQRRGELPGELASVYEENVGVVDEAIDRSRQALAADPDDEQLQALLDDAYRRKLDLLQQVAAIPGRTRDATF